MAISDLRKKLKATPVANLEKADQELDKALGREDRGNSEYHKFKVGTNVHRIYPPHEEIDPGTGLPCSFAEPKVTVFLPAMVQDRDAQNKEQKDDKGNIRMKLGAKPVFNCTIHGKKDAQGNPVSKDAVEEYIRLVGEKAAKLYPDNTDERKKYQLYIYGVFTPDPKNRVQGITYNAKWVVYSDLIEGGEIKKFALLEVGKAVKNRWNQIAAIEAGDEVMGTDPFTDIDDGRATKIIYNDKATKADDYYTTEIDNTTEEVMLEGGRKGKVQKVYPLSDDQIESFYKHPSLAKMFRNVFKRSDLDLQLWGLKEIDKKGEYGVFDSDEFQAIAEEIASHYSEEESESNNESSESSKEEEKSSADDVFQPATNHETKKFEDMPFDKKAGDDYDLMTRDELKEFCKDNNTGILIKPASVMSDDDLRDRVRIWEKGLSSTTSIDNTDSAVQEEEKENDKAEQAQSEMDQAPAMTIEDTGDGIDTSTVPKLSAKERLEALKNAQK